jgi:DNA-directed RNA polymerase specialized sigma24 family protein
LREKLSQIPFLGRSCSVNAPSDLVADASAQEAALDLEALFRVHFSRVARAVGRVVGDPGRAEELAVEAFLKLWRNSQVQGDRVEGWLYRTAIR